ncbi:damage-inducible protein CinA [Serinicoccus chungangensis]|uniref:Damage-inducible protein CinA n=1 Tax=Serinicoccus chungangensis TaxID=767452 RepID=A0A0W8IH05_9MICO|nr:nicotinamide-nucleotide amidohydrolase family protein [Serinicoccus chungangensis]KUG59281.1 damage-inducible protein CinA [Serinicoccus chungangensis]
MTGSAGEPRATALVRDLLERGESVATAESLTGGLVCAALTDVPGASGAVRGSVVAYATPVKEQVLGVGDGVLTGPGTVSQECAEAMALGGARVLHADWCVSTTGVAGPGPSEGAPAGTVHVAVAHREQVVGHRVFSLHGDRDHIRRATVSVALDLLQGCLTRGVSGGEGTVEAAGAATASASAPGPARVDAAAPGTTDAKGEEG